jgi:hypothetical protein
MVARGTAVVRVAWEFGTAGHRVRAWRDRYLAHGREGLADAPRIGRPPKLGSADLALLEDALEQGPQLSGWPVTLGSVRDLREFLWQQRCVRVSASTVHRAILG